MPFIPPLFKDIGKALSDHLTNVFDDEKERESVLLAGPVLKFKTKSEDGVTIDSYTHMKGGKLFSEINADGGIPKGTFSLKLNSNTEVEFSATTKSLYKGLKSKLAAKHAKKGNKGVLDLSYKKDFFAGQAKMTADFAKKTLKAELSATIGEDNLSVGAMYPVELNKDGSLKSKLGFDDLSLGVELKLKDLECTLLTKPKSEMELGFFQKVSTKTKLGGKFHVPAEESDDMDPTLHLGVAHTVDPTLCAHAVFTSKGAFKGALSKKFTEPNLCATLAFGMDLTKGTEIVQPIGVTIALGDK